MSDGAEFTQFILCSINIYVKWCSILLNLSTIKEKIL